MAHSTPIEPPTSTGGTRALAGWVAWAAATLFVFYQLIVQNAWGALDGQIRADLHLTVTQATLASAVFLGMYGLMQVPAGLLIDRLGPGRVLAPAAGLLAMAAWAFAHVDGFVMPLLMRGVMGAVAAFAFPGAGLIARRRLSPSLFPLAMGLIDAIFGLGLWAGDAGVAQVLGHEHWRDVMTMLGVAGIGMAVLCLMCIPPIGVSQRPGDGSIRSDLARLLGDGHIRRTTLVYGLVCGITFGFAGLWNVALQEAWGYSHDQSVVFNGWIYIGLAACAPLVGLAGMRTNRRRPLLMAGIALALVCVLVILFAPVPRNSSLVALLHLLLGVGISAGILCFPIGCRSVVQARVGTAIGLINAVGLLAATLFQLIPGLLLARWGEPTLPVYQGVLSIFALGLALALPLAWSVTKPIDHG